MEGKDSSHRTTTLGRFREIYSTSPDQSPSRSPSPSGSSRKLPAQIRLQRLKAELEQLELDLGQAGGADSSIDPGAMMHGLSELRGRLNNLGTGESKSASHKLLSKVVTPAKSSSTPADSVAGNGITNGVKSADVSNEATASTGSDILSSLDQRLGELELLIGASNATLDEVSPLQRILITSTLITLSAVIASSSTPPSPHKPTLEHPLSSHPAASNRRSLSAS